MIDSYAPNIHIYLCYGNGKIQNNPIFLENCRNLPKIRKRPAAVVKLQASCLSSHWSFLVADFSALRLVFLFLGLGARFDLDRHGLSALRYVNHDFIHTLCHSVFSFHFKAPISAFLLYLYIFLAKADRRLKRVF